MVPLLPVTLRCCELATLVAPYWATQLRAQPGLALTSSCCPNIEQRSTHTLQRGHPWRDGQIKLVATSSHPPTWQNQAPLVKNTLQAPQRCGARWCLHPPSVSLPTRGKQPQMVHPPSLAICSLCLSPIPRVDFCRPCRLHAGARLAWPEGAYILSSRASCLHGSLRLEALTDIG